MKFLLKQLGFVVLTSTGLYFISHIQFLLGIPQAGLAVIDWGVFLLIGALSYSLATGKKKRYFVIFALIWFLLIQSHYIYMKIFNKTFSLDEFSKTYTLLIVSPFWTRIKYIIFLLLYVVPFLGMLFLTIKDRKHLHILQLSIAIICGFTLTKIYTKSIPVNANFITFDQRHVFFYSGIVKSIQFVTPSFRENVDRELVEKTVQQLKQIEQDRKTYPTSDSPISPPEKKRPIAIFIIESFYDYKHFLHFFDKDPRPQDYLDLINENTYSGPAQSYGSFDARFVTLTGSSVLKPNNETSQYYPTLGTTLQNYGYTTYALESVETTYGLLNYYDMWGFDTVKFRVYGRDWSGKDTPPNTYVNNVIDIITNTPSEVTPFYFGFTYLGHGGSLGFTDVLEDPQIDISRYLDLFSEGDQHFAKQMLKSAIFNAQRIVELKNAVLAKYPDALIVFKADHYSTDLNLLLDKSSLAQEEKDRFYQDPTPLPLLVIDGTNGVLPLKRGYNPANIAFLTLAEAGLPYSNTTFSLMYSEEQPNTININEKLYSKQGKYFQAMAHDKTYSNMVEKNRLHRIISTDIYKGENHTVNILKNN